MALSPGDKLGPYEILSPIGAGGMGDVYKARDTRLDRIVAIKVSKTEFSERFEREAQAIAALNHSNICQLYDVGPNYLVMEYIEGTPLKGPLPLDQALKYAAQICDALDAAHKKGITHRDLKPANILVTKAGIKLLDFGLAKLASANSGPSLKPDDATLTMALTGKNEIVGTLFYMSPEQLQAQANGQEIDGRSDIFSFGLVLYEILTGKRAFEGSSPASVIAAIMERPAPSIAAVAPPALERLLQRCLAKDPDDRWQTARDLTAELEWIAKAPESGSAAPVAPAKKSRLAWTAWCVAAALAVLAGWAFLRAPKTESKPVSRWTMPLDVAITTIGLGVYGEAGVALSHDGTHLAYENRGQIWVRALDQLEGKPVPGTQGGSRPVFSPDGQWLAFLPGGMNGPIRKIPVNGGSPTVLCEDATYYGASWGADGTIVFSSGKGLMRVPESGGKCEPVTTLDTKKNEAHRWPQILPGGQAVAFAVGTPGDFGNSHLAVVDLKSGKIQVFENTGSAVRYTPSGHVLYVRSGTLFAAPFDVNRLAVTGPEVPVAEGVYHNPTGGFADYSFSDSGLLVYSAEVRAISFGGFAWLDRNGSPQRLAAPPHSYSWHRISPDGRRVLMGVHDSPGTYGDLWVYDLDRGSMNRLTSGNFTAGAAWTEDSRRVAYFSSQERGKRGVFWTAADGTGTPEQLLEHGGVAVPTSWTPDGKTLFYQVGSPTRIWSIRPGGKPQPISQSAFNGNEAEAAVSPDGQWVAYDTDESGTTQVYAKPISGTGARVAISIESGKEPRWSRDGRELFYRDPVKNKLMAVEMRLGTTIKVGQTKALFALGDVPWDAAPDGRRFLVVQRQGDVPTAKLQVVVNFFEELQRKAPTGK